MRKRDFQAQVRCRPSTKDSTSPAQPSKKRVQLALDYFKRFETLDVKSKGVQDMASEADVETQKLLESKLMGAFPDDAFLGEEDPEAFVPDPQKGTWIIDPVDGTQPFVNGIPSWCVSIAYVEGTTFKIGIVFDPVNNELFAAKAGGGATLNGRPISASRAVSLEEGLVSVGFSNRVTPGGHARSADAPHESQAACITAVAVVL